MVVLTSIFVAEIRGRRGSTELLAAELFEDKRLPNEDSSALEDMRELIGMYEGKNRVQPME